MHTAAAVFLLAGLCSQVRWDPATGDTGCDQDRDQAHRHAKALFVEVKTFLDLANNLIREDWERVQALAAVLLNRQTLSGVDAALVLEAAPPSLT